MITHWHCRDRDCQVEPGPGRPDLLGWPPAAAMVEGPVFAIVTPFTSEGRVDEEGLIRSLHFFASKVQSIRRIVDSAGEIYPLCRVLKLSWLAELLGSLHQ